MYSMSFGDFGVWVKSKEMTRNVVHSPYWYGKEWWRRELRRDVVKKAKSNKGYARKYRRLVLSAAQAQNVDFDFGDGTWVSDYERYYTDKKTRNPKTPDDRPVLNPEGLKRVGQRILKGDANIDLLDKDLAATTLHPYILSYERQQAAKTTGLIARPKPLVAALRIAAPGAPAPPAPTPEPTPEMTPEEQALLMMMMQQQAAAAQPEKKVDWLPWAIGGGALLVGGGVAAALIIRKRRKAKAEAVAGW
jgi:hypothetical protein